MSDTLVTTEVSIFKNGEMFYAQAFGEMYGPYANEQTAARAIAYVIATAFDEDNDADNP